MVRTRHVDRGLQPPCPPCILKKSCGEIPELNRRVDNVGLLKHPSLVSPQNNRPSMPRKSNMPTASRTDSRAFRTAYRFTHMLLVENNPVNIWGPVRPCKTGRSRSVYAWWRMAERRLILYPGTSDSDLVRFCMSRNTLRPGEDPSGTQSCTHRNTSHVIEDACG